MYVTCDVPRSCLQAVRLDMFENPHALLRRRAVSPRCWTPRAKKPFYDFGTIPYDGAVVFTGRPHDVLKAMMKKEEYSLRLSTGKGVFVYLMEVRHMGLTYCIVAGCGRKLDKPAHVGLMPFQFTSLMLQDMALAMAEAYPIPLTRGQLKEEYRRVLGHPELESRSRL